MKKSVVILICIIIVPFLFSCHRNNDSSAKLYLSALEEYSHKNFDEALNILSIAKKAGSTSPQMDFLTAKIYFFQNKYSESSGILEKLQKSNPEFTEARIWKIRCDIVSGNYDLAKEELDRELEINMTDWRVFYLYALLCQKTGKIDEQLIMLNHIIMIEMKFIMNIMIFIIYFIAVLLYIKMKILQN